LVYRRCATLFQLCALRLDTSMPLKKEIYDRVQEAKYLPQPSNWPQILEQILPIEILSEHRELRAQQEKAEITAKRQTNQEALKALKRKDSEDLEQAGKRRRNEEWRAF